MPVPLCRSLDVAACVKNLELSVIRNLPAARKVGEERIAEVTGKLSSTVEQICGNVGNEAVFKQYLKVLLTFVCFVFYFVAECDVGGQLQCMNLIK